MIACVFCHTELGRKMTGWTGRKLAEPVKADEPFSAVTQPGWRAVCPSCTLWLRQRDRHFAPVGLVRAIRKTCSGIKTSSGKECQDVLIAHARKVADALGPEMPIRRAMEALVAEGPEANP